MSRSRMGIRKGPPLTHGEVLFNTPPRWGNMQFRSVCHSYNTTRVSVCQYPSNNNAKCCKMQPLHLCGVGCLSPPNEEKARALSDRKRRAQSARATLELFRGWWYPPKPPQGGFSRRPSQRAQSPPRGDPPSPTRKPHGVSLSVPPVGSICGKSATTHKSRRSNRGADRGKRELSVDAERLHRNKREKARALSERS